VDTCCIVAKQAAAAYEAEKAVLQKGIDDMVRSFGLNPNEI